VRGRGIDIFIDNNQKFSADLDGDTYTADSFDALKKQLNNSLIKRKLNIAVTMLNTTWRSNTQELTHGTLIGVHSSNGNFMVLSDGKIQQIRTYSPMYRGFSKDEAKEHEDLTSAKVEAEIALEKFLEERHINIVDVRDALLGKGPLAEYDKPMMKQAQQKRSKR
jgi:predicted ATPase